MKCDTQHNNAEHIGTQYRELQCWVSFVPSVIYAVCLKSPLCWVSLCWVSICWVSKRPQRPLGVFQVSLLPIIRCNCKKKFFVLFFVIFLFSVFFLLQKQKLNFDWLQVTKVQCYTVFYGCNLRVFVRASVLVPGGLPQAGVNVIKLFSFVADDEAK